MTQQVAIVTGGANGIGEATSRCFAKTNVRVVIADIDQAKGKALEIELNTQGFSARYFPTDTSSEESIKEMVDHVESIYSRVDYLVNGAAKFVIKGIDASVSDWQNSFQVNVIGYAMCIKHCIPLMKKNGGGSIVNIGSVSGYIAQPDFVTYSTAKGAITAMTRCLARDLAKYQIRVNAIHPGSVWTKTNEEFHRTHLNMTRQEAETNDVKQQNHILGRFADPEEIAKIIVFLASNDASFVTGANWLADGGYTAW